MPIFDYQCNDCGKIYDVFHKGKELVEDIVCPSCGATGFKKLMSAPMVSMGSSSASESSYSSCDTGSCCGGSCGIN
jgi:putative FmdB family regulatory protein